MWASERQTSERQIATWLEAYEWVLGLTMTEREYWGLVGEWNALYHRILAFERGRFPW